MALEWIYKIGGSGTSLTQEEQDNNARCFYGLMTSNYNWHLKAIAGALGCFHEESLINPGVYETSHGGDLSNLPYFPGGMGIAQWTDYPAYAGTYPNPLPWSADRQGELWYNGNFQGWLLTKCDDPNYTSMGYGQGPRWGWQTSSTYPSISFSNYITNDTMTVEQACEYWFFCLEWHYWDVPAGYLESRKEWAKYYYEYLTGQNPEVPGGGGTPVDPDDPSNSPWFWYMILARKRRWRRERDNR